MAESTNEVDFDEVLERCALWESDAEELRELGAIIRGAYEGDQLFEVQCMAEELLKDQLPSFYKAQMCAYLSTCDDYDSHAYLDLATSHLEDAKDGLDWIPNEVAEWEEIIKNQKPRVAEYELALATSQPGVIHTAEINATTFVSSMDGTQEGASEAADPLFGVPPFYLKSVKANKNKNKNKNRNRKIREKQEKLAAQNELQPEPVIPTIITEDVDDEPKGDLVQSIKAQKIRQQKANLPLAIRRKLSAANQASGEGSVGVIKQSKLLRPKPSLTTFDIWRNEQDRNVKEDKDVEEPKDNEGSDEIEKNY